MARESNRDEIACIVCMESFNKKDDTCGIACPSGHYICQNDFTSYLAENVFPQVFRLRDTRCAISCPAHDCQSTFNALFLFQRMPQRERSRYLSIIADTVASQTTVSLLKSALLDVMTLKCPSCKTPVDPFPDACSAVMCLNCGNHYCNYCFSGFATGVIERDRAAAHEHVATHNTAERPEGRDAFLSAEMVVNGQREHQMKQLEKCLSLAMSSPEYATNGAHDVAVALILCANEILDLRIDVLKLWRSSERRVIRGNSHNGSSKRGATASSRSNKSSSRSTNISNGSETDTGHGGGSIDTNGNGNSMHVDDDDDNCDDDSNGGSYSSDASDDDDGNEEDDAEAANAQERTRIRRQAGIQLANAIITNNPHAITQILHTYQESGIDLDYVDEKHGHPLASLAILAGQPNIAIKLIEQGADPFKLNGNGRTVMYIATESGLDDVIRAIVRVYPDLNLDQPVTTEIQRYRPIHVAARYNHGHLVREFASLGANLDVEENEHGYTPLTLALVLGHEWAASELMLAGAQVRLAATNGRTPMFVAAEKGLGEMIRLMVAYCKVDVNEPVVLPSGLRLLHVAAFHQQAHIVSQLIEMGADVNLVDDEGGYNPLTMAIIGGNLSAAVELINAGADIRMPSQSGRAPMYVAVEKGMTEVVRMLITQCGIGVNERTTSEPSAAKPLHVAVLHGQAHLIPTLLTLGADVNAVDQEKLCTPLIMATILQDEWSARLLIRAGADATRLSREGRSAAYVAAEKGHVGILRMLIERCGISVNAPTTSEPHRGSPLHIACMFDNAHTISQLLLIGADAAVPDALGRTPLDLARETSSFAAEDVILRHLEDPGRTAAVKSLLTHIPTQLLPASPPHTATQSSSRSPAPAAAAASSPRTSSSTGGSGGGASSSSSSWQTVLSPSTTSAATGYHHPQAFVGVLAPGHYAFHQGGGGVTVAATATGGVIVDTNHLAAHDIVFGAGIPHTAGITVNVHPNNSRASNNGSSSSSGGAARTGHTRGGSTVAGRGSPLVRAAAQERARAARGTLPTGDRNVHPSATGATLQLQQQQQQPPQMVQPAHHHHPQHQHQHQPPLAPPPPPSTQGRS